MPLFQQANKIHGDTSGNTFSVLYSFQKMTFQVTNLISNTLMHTFVFSIQKAWRKHKLEFREERNSKIVQQ